jgi:exopolysaccharide biosynthesis polyprenyl glycosylphosphotransferase
MFRGTPHRLGALFADLAAVVGALALATAWASHSWSLYPAVSGQWPLDALLRLGIFAATWVFVAGRLGTYTPAANSSPGAALRSVLEAWATTWGIGGLIDVSVLSGLNVWGSLLAGTALLLLRRLIVFKPSLLAAASNRSRMLVVGACPSLRTLGLMHNADVDLVGVVPLPGESTSSVAHLQPVGRIDELSEVLARHEVDVALICPSDQALTGDVHKVFSACKSAGLGVHYFPSFLDLGHLRPSLTWSDNRPGLRFDAPSRWTVSATCKRTMDIVGAATGIVALLPALTLCALGVKLTSRGPVLFRQARVGKNGKNFECLKFRTMREGTHALQDHLRAASTQDGPAFKIPRDPRVTPIGRFLRKFSLDELPQMFNVLLGDMSLVGPRPPIPSEVKNYTWWQRRRISVKPGLTCIWQVWGRNRVPFKRWVEMDLFYIDNWSLWLDLKLIAHTVRVVFSGTGM